MVVPILLAAAALVQPAAASVPAKPMPLLQALGMKQPGLRGAELAAALARASSFPLGSLENPVRTTGLKGEQQYLARLRCANGRRPRVHGRQVAPPSPFGGVTDRYHVECRGSTPATAAIHMDMYHEHREDRPVSGFTIAR